MIGRSFGQHEPLTTRLHNLVRSYPKGLGIFKEFIQNADDAEANEIVFIIDEQQYNFEGLPDSMQWLHTTPALLVYNNRPFSKHDIQSIQKIGESGKSLSMGKTGRFGLGFNACYNVTDVPYFYTKNEMYFFDPHFKTVPEASSKSPGRYFNVDELISEGWPLLDAFHDFVSYGSVFKGTVFRLPFRTVQQARISEIKKDRYKVSDALDAVRELQDMGSTILLFLKHIRRLKVDHRKSDGSVVNLLSMHASNTKEINQSRVEVNELLSSSDPEHILTELSIKGQVYSSCRHEYEVVVEGLEHTEAWRVVDGFFVDNDDKVISACRNMIQNEEKALPYAGAAWPLNLNHTVPGRVFCFLPVPIQTNIPIQINGYFDLDDSRQSMFLDPSSHGSAGNRVEWNKALLENSVVPAYIRLLEELRTDIETDCVDMYYCAFPKVVDNDRSWEGWLANSFYRQASLAPLFRVSGATIWSNLSSSRSLPEELLLVGEALIADEFLPILDPPLPEHIITGFKNNQINVPMLTPQDLAFGLEQEQDVDCTMDDAPLNCLRKREYVEQILSFFLNDFPADEMEGLPLVIDCRGHLRTLGLTETPLYIAGQSWDLEVFSDHLEWFVDTKLVRNLNLIENEVTGLHYMDNKSFTSELDKYISSKTVNGELKLRRRNTGTLTDTWLQAVFSRLLASNIRNLQFEIRGIPLVPDQNHILHPVGNASTPLLFHSHKSDLKKALIELSVPIVTGISKELFALLLEFSEKEDLIWSVTPRDLVDTLVAQSKEILDEYEKVTDVHKALLNFLSREDSLTSLRELRETRIKLKKLRLFPTTNSTLVDLEQPAYIAQEFKFPAGDFKVILLDDGPSHKWRELYRELEVPELSRSRLIKEILLPEFKQFDITARAKASGWLRDNLNLAQSEEEFDSDELFEEIRSTPFIVCEDGELRAPMSIYHPESKLARTVLADEAQFPDMKTTYAVKSKTWLSFFRNLEMATEPRLSDIVEYLRKLVTEDSCEHTRDRFETVFEFLKERIETDLQGETDISDELSEALEELAQLPWIPIRQNAGDLLCFKSPDVDFACPGEVYFPRVGQLIASQAYITVFKQEPNKRISTAMGFASKPPLTLVINHFKEVLAAFSNQITIANEAALVKGLGQIYRFFGEGEDTADIDALEEDVGYQDSDNTSNLKTMFAQVPCIWDQENRCFWKPDHVFMENVWYMEPWRRTIRANEKLIESGYEALGRKEQPTVDDWKQVLQEISESGKTSEELVIREVVRRIVDELIRIDSADGEVLVPTRDDKLLPAKGVFIADAPWYESRLDFWDIPIVASSVSGIFEIQKALTIPSLAESVIERLIKDPLASNLEDESCECCRLEDLIRSNEFINGYQRLLRHENHEIAINSLLFIQEVRVRCVKSIETCLYLHYDETEQLLGDAKADFYWDQDRLQALVTEKRRRYFYDDLATMLNQTLGDRHLKDLSPLVHILRCEPYEIAEVLDDLKIRKVVLDPEEKPETDVEVTLQEFPDDEIHNIYENECSATEDVIDPGSDSANFNEDEEEAATITIDNLDHDNVSSHSHVISQSKSSIPRDYKQIADKSEDEIPKGGSENRTLTDTVESGPKDRTTDISDIEKSQLTPATKDVSRVPTANSNKPAAVRQRLVSYVIQSETGPSSADYLSGNNDSNLKIGNAAVDIVIDHEKKSGRKARSMAHPNPGYDVISECDGETRYIEVKGTELAWGERGVALSSTQFFYAREHPDRDFWLYVVENVFSENPKIHKIHNPSGKVDCFMFDGGWRQTAESVDENPAPSPDDEVPY